MQSKQVLDTLLDECFSGEGKTHYYLPTEISKRSGVDLGHFTISKEKSQAALKDAISQS